MPTSRRNESYVQNCNIHTPDGMSAEQPALFTEVTASHVYWPDGQVVAHQKLVVCALDNMAILPMVEYHRLKKAAGELK